MYHRGAFKREAKQRMRASVPHFMLVTLVYYLLTWGLSTAIGQLTGWISLGMGMLSLFLVILVNLFVIVMNVGFSNYALCLARREETGMGSLFQPFSFAGRSLGVTLLVALFLFLWAMLFTGAFSLVVGLMATLAYNMDLVAVIAVELYLAGVVLVVIISLRYVMAVFALVDDPDAGVMEAIRRSVRMMRGYKGKYFVLQLSYLGWDLLVWLIGAVVLAAGVFTIGLDWFWQLFRAVEQDPWAGYTLVWAITERMALWSLLSQLITLPLSMWVAIYRQTAMARFYNYVSGYDYHQYMNAKGAPRPVDPLNPPQPGPEETPPFDPDPSEPPEAPSGPSETLESHDAPAPTTRTEEPPPAAPGGYYTSVLPPEPGDDEDEEL